MTFFFLSCMSFVSLTVSFWTILKGSTCETTAKEKSCNPDCQSTYFTCQFHNVELEQIHQIHKKNERKLTTRYLSWQEEHQPQHEETAVEKLKKSRAPKCEIRNITGHTSEQGLNKYDFPDEQQQQPLSNIIGNISLGIPSQVYPSNSSATFPGYSTPGQVYNFSHCRVTLNTASDHPVTKCSVKPSMDPSRSLLKTLILIKIPWEFFNHFKSLNFALKKHFAHSPNSFQCIVFLNK